jgi:hypothetical protein
VAAYSYYWNIKTLNPDKLNITKILYKIFLFINLHSDKYKLLKP